MFLTKIIKFTFNILYYTKNELMIIIIYQIILFFIDFILLYHIFHIFAILYYKKLLIGLINLTN